MMKCNQTYMVLTLFIFLSLYAPLTTSLPINVSLGFLTPLHESLGPLSVLGKELESAFKLAVDAVNNKDDNIVFIRGNFTAAVKDETTDPSAACRFAARTFHKSNDFVGIVGGYFSECAVAVQKELKALNSYLSQLSYRSPSIQLSDKMKYPGFYRMVSNNKEQAQVFIDLIKHFRWNQVGIIHTTDLYYGKELSDEIVSKMTLQYDIRVQHRVQFEPGASDAKIDDSLYRLKSSGSRINIIVAQGKDVFNILRRLKAKDMYGKGWVWIISDGGACLDLSLDADTNGTAGGMVGIAPEMFKGKAYVDTIILQWFKTDQEEYPGKFWRSANMATISPFVGQVYLAVSTYHNVLTELAMEGNLTKDTDISVVRKMLRAKFQSMDVIERSRKSILANKVYFKDHTDGPPIFTVANYVGSDFKWVGEWDGKVKDETKRLEFRSNTIVWPGGSLKPPKVEGKPGKLLFRVGFVAPTNHGLGALSEYGRELVSAFKVAVDMFNNDKNYQIEFEPVIKDEGTDGVASCYKVAKEMKDINLVGVVGAYRSQCSMELHKVFATDSSPLPIVSYASLSRKLSNKALYKYFFRVVPSNEAEAEIMKQIVVKYKFKEVSILFSDEISSKEIALQFLGHMVNNSIPVTLSEEFTQNANVEDLRRHIKQIRQTGSRVIFVSALPNDARLIMQIIKELDMAGKGWIWFGSDGFSTQNIPRSSGIGKVLNGMIGVNPKRGDGELYNKFLSVWKNKDSFDYPGMIHSTQEYSLPFTAQVYDAVKAIFSALSDLVLRREVTFETKTLHIRKLLYKRLKTFNDAENGFSSANGKFSKMYFDENQNAPLSFDIVNLVENNWRKIAKYPVKADAIEFIDKPIFPGGSSKPVVNPGKIIYKVAAFFPKNSELNPLSELGAIWESALHAVVHWLSKNESLTVGYEVLTYDTGMFPSNNCSELVKDLPKDVDIIIGAARSGCTQSLYEDLEHLGIPMITYASTSSVLSKKTSYPNLFRVCSSDTHQAVALADLIEKYSWEKVGIIGSKDIYGQELSNDLKNLLTKRKISVTTRQTFEEGDEDMKEQIQSLKSGGSGVNLIIANPAEAMHIYQEAFESNMVGGGWTWLGSDGPTSTSFKRKQNLLAAMQGMVGFRPKAGSGSLFDSIYQEWHSRDPIADKTAAYVPQLFDSILIPTLALHDLHMEKDSTVLRKVTPRELIEYLRQMQSADKGFKSSTGWLQYFDSHQDLLPLYDLVNLNGDWVTVGGYEDGQIDITSGVVWSGGTIKIPPSDPPEYVSVPFEGSGDGKSTGLVVLAVVFGVFSLLVIVFMVYIVRRVRHRHLYMQSDINHGGVFSVLYGHTVNRPGLPLNTSNGHLKIDNSIDSGNVTDIVEPMIPRKV